MARVQSVWSCMTMISTLTPLSTCLGSVNEQQYSVEACQLRIRSAGRRRGKESDWLWMNRIESSSLHCRLHRHSPGSVWKKKVSVCGRWWLHARSSMTWLSLFPFCQRRPSLKIETLNNNTPGAMHAARSGHAMLVGLSLPLPLSRCSVHKALCTGS